MTEHDVIEQLTGYKRLVARIKVLSNYSVGAGITVSRLNEDDHLQELHARLRGMPSYMYLSKREQQLETVAHTYLQGQYPVGIKNQQRAIASVGEDEEDTKLLKELKRKIDKVIAARGYTIRSDMDEVLERVSELQDLQAEVKRIDGVMEALEQYKPDYEKLLRWRYIEALSVRETSFRLNVTERTLRRWNTVAVQEYIKLSA
ncbi:ECF-type sigma factor [Paenibacillus septentrionalis]|uniref:ECF-type sigma factor n=1 Tax=Paenibacillus septentrionalis TaxID=429342 RepID=A0ABW1V692_9BACL